MTPALQPAVPHRPRHGRSFGQRRGGSLGRGLGASVRAATLWPAARVLAALLAIGGLGCGASGAASAARPDFIHGQAVRFPSVAGPEERSVLLRGWLYLPDLPQGKGRVPAVVLMHGCGGPKVPSHRWAEQLNAWGYAALVLDSFGPRGIAQVCSEPAKLSSPARTADAYGALQFLQGQRGIDPDRIGLMGWSHGGSSALWAVDRSWSLAHQPYPWLRFRATGVFYPGCNFSHSGFTTPVLMLMGAADDWTPASPCRRMVKTTRASNGRIELVIYPGATHAFDGVRITVQAYGHVLEPNPAATRDAHARVHEFLDKHLKP